MNYCYYYFIGFEFIKYTAEKKAQILTKYLKILQNMYNHKYTLFGGGILLLFSLYIERASVQSLSPVKLKLVSCFDEKYLSFYFN